MCNKRKENSTVENMVKIVKILVWLVLAAVVVMVVVKKLQNRKKTQRRTNRQEVPTEEEKLLPVKQDPQLRREQEARATEKGRLDNQISTALSSDTGILALWNQIEMGIASGNVTLFQVYGASFLKKVDSMNALVAKYQAIRPLPTDPKGDPMTRSLELPLESEDAVQKVNRQAEKLKASGILENKDLNAKQLQDWYQGTFQ